MTIQLSPDRVGLPPPMARHGFDLIDGGVRVGWVRAARIGFAGFASATDAAHAAWVAFRTLMRRIARRDGGRPIPVDTEPLTIGADGYREAIYAGRRLVATLVRPGGSSRSGRHSFGFEIEVPPPADEATLRSSADLLYRALRKSGVRWALWARTRRESLSGLGAAWTDARLEATHPFTGGPSDDSQSTERRPWRVRTLSRRRTDRMGGGQGRRISGLR